MSLNGCSRIEVAHTLHLFKSCWLSSIRWRCCSIITFIFISIDAFIHRHFLFISLFQLCCKKYHRNLVFRKREKTKTVEFFKLIYNTSVLYLKAIQVNDTDWNSWNCNQILIFLIRNRQKIFFDFFFRMGKVDYFGIIWLNTIFIEWNSFLEWIGSIALHRQCS